MVAQDASRYRARFQASLSHSIAQPRPGDEAGVWKVLEFPIGNGVLRRFKGKEISLDKGSMDRQ